MKKEQKSTKPSIRRLVKDGKEVTEQLGVEPKPYEPAARITRFVKDGVVVKEEPFPYEQEQSSN